MAAETVEIGKSCDGMALANDRNGVRSVSPTRAERHRATWPGPKGGRPELFVGDGAPIGCDDRARTPASESVMQPCPIFDSFDRLYRSC